MYVTGGPRPRSPGSKVIVEATSRGSSPAGEAKSKASPKEAMKAKAKAAPKARASKSGAGVLSQLLTQFEKGIVSRVVWGVNWALQQVFVGFSALLLPGMLAVFVSYVQPDFWFLDLDADHFEVDVGLIYSTETVMVAAFLLWVRWLGRSAPKKTHPFGLVQPPDLMKKKDEVGVALTWGGAVTALWAPRASAVLFGVASLGACRRAGLHFSPPVCFGATCSMLACVLRLVWAGDGAVPIAVALAILLQWAGIRLLGDERVQEIPLIRGLAERLGNAIPGELLLHAVAPRTLQLYMGAL